MRHPRRAPRRRRSSAAAAPLLLVALLAPAAAVAGETPRAVSRERGPQARASAPARPSTPAQPSQPAARGSDRGAPSGGSAVRLPDDRRGDRRDRAENRFRGRHGHRYFYPGYYHYGGWYGGWYGGFWASLLFGAYDYPWGYGYGHGGRYRGWDGNNQWGALDLDVSPAKTEVYLDGQYLGRVDAFDGFPQYLWLEEGTYDLVLFKEGYRTIARQITVLPGVVIEVDHRLEPGDSVRPENLASTSHERRDRRLRYEREARARAGEDDDEAMEETEEAEVEERDEEAEEGRGRSERGRAEVGRVRLEVEPDDASVYLDGRFLGTGAEIGRLHAGLILDRGAHRLAVVRPGYRARELEFEVREGEEVELEVVLQPGS